MIGRMNNVNNLKLKFNICTQKINSSVVQQINYKPSYDLLYSNDLNKNNVIIAKGNSGATKSHITENDCIVLKN